MIKLEITRDNLYEIARLLELLNLEGGIADFGQGTCYHDKVYYPGDVLELTEFAIK